MPVAARNLFFHIRARCLPAGSGDLIFVAVVAVFHHVVDANAFIAVIIVVGLPDGAEAVDAQFPVVTEIPAERIDFAAVQFATKRHAFLIRLAIRDDFISCNVYNQFAIGRMQFVAAVAKVEVKSTVRAERETVNSMVVLSSLDAREEHFLAIGFGVAVIVVEAEHAVARGDNDSIAQHADSVSRIDVAALIEHRFLVGHAVAVSVFQNQNAVAFSSIRIVAVGKSSIVNDFANPDATKMIDVDVRWAEQHRFGGEELQLNAVGHIEARNSVLWRAINGSVLSDRSPSRRVNKELHTGAHSLIGTTIVEAGASNKLLVTFRQFEVDNRIGMSADTELNRLARDSHIAAVGVFVDADIAPVGGGVLPFQVGEFQLALWPDKFWLGPVRPVAAVTVAAVCDNKVQILLPLDVGFNLCGVPRCICRNKRCRRNRFRWSGETRLICECRNTQCGREISRGKTSGGTMEKVHGGKPPVDQVGMQGSVLRPEKPQAEL